MFFSHHRKENRSGAAEFKQEVMKTQTLPRSNGAQARRALFERMNTEPAKYFKCSLSIILVPDIQSILSDGVLCLS